MFAIQNIYDMNQYDPVIHHRHSLRLKNYDYASEGLYFVTICTQHRELLFGTIDKGVLFLNDAGRMVERWYFEIEQKYPGIACREMIVMPNHFHCIWQNLGNSNDESTKATSLSAVVRWFKTMTTNEYIRGVEQLGWRPFNQRLWQRNYYEHIIRNELSYRTIANYIIKNPVKWKHDRFNPR